MSIDARLEGLAICSGDAHATPVPFGYGLEKCLAIDFDPVDSLAMQIAVKIIVELSDLFRANKTNQAAPPIFIELGCMRHDPFAESASLIGYPVAREFLAVDAAPIADDCVPHEKCFYLKFVLGNIYGSPQLPVELLIGLEIGL